MKKVLYIDMDNTLVDFPAGLVRAEPAMLEEYSGREDEIPDVFSWMPPLPGAVEAFHELSELFDTYILSTAPWLNPSAWRHKLEWVHQHLGVCEGSPAYKRLILSHHKNLNRGDFLVDDRPKHNGAQEFEGEVIPFGESGYDDWPMVTAYLRSRS